MTVENPQPHGAAKPAPSPTGQPTVGQESSVDVGIVALYQNRRWDEACSLLYQIYWSSILAITTRRMRGWLERGGLTEQAEDVALQALHRVHDSLRRLAEEGRINEIATLRAWIRRIVQRQVYDTLSIKAGRKEWLSQSGDVEGSVLEDSAGLSEAKVIELMDGDRRLTDLRACVKAVEGRVGNALRFWLKGNTYKEVARELVYASFSAAQSAVQGAIRKVGRCMSAKGWEAVK